MHYRMTTPCNECPFLEGSHYTVKQLRGYSSGEFACHKACELNEDDQFVEKGPETPHCAGALIYLEKREQPHQMMRIAERLRMYDRRKLNMKAKVR